MRYRRKGKYVVNKNSGFTLIEVLIALMIIVTIVGSVITIFMEIIYIKNKSASYYDITKVAQSIMEDIKTFIIIIDGKEEKVLPMEMEKRLNFVRDGYDSEVFIQRVHSDKGIYEVIVKVKDVAHDIESILYARIYDISQDSIYEKIYYELPI